MSTAWNWFKDQTRVVKVVIVVILGVMGAACGEPEVTVEAAPATTTTTAAAATTTTEATTSTQAVVCWQALNDRVNSLGDVIKYGDEAELRDEVPSECHIDAAIEELEDATPDRVIDFYGDYHEAFTVAEENPDHELAPRIEELRPEWEAVEDAFDYDWSSDTRIGT